MHFSKMQQASAQSRTTVMRTRKFLLLLVVLVSASMSQAQEDTLWLFFDKPTTFHSYEADNARYPAFTISAGASTASRPLGEADFAGSLQLRWQLSELLTIQARADHHINPNYDTQYRWVADNPDIRTENTLKPYSYQEATASVAFPVALRKTNELSVNTTGPYGERKTHLLQKEIPTTIMFGGRAGALRYTSLAHNYLLDEGQLIDAEGTILHAGGPVDIRHRDPGPTFITNFQSLGVLGGVFVSWHRHLQYTVTDRYHKTEKRATRADRMVLFADLIPFSALQMDPMTVDGTEHDVYHNDAGGFHYQSAGWRLGLEVESMRAKHHGYAFQLELGMRPGINNSAYDVPPFGKRMFVNTRILYVFGAG